MARREFSRAVKVAVVKRATRNSVVYCEGCGLPAKKWQIDHIVADAHGGEPVIENAQLLCDVCYGVKNPQDTTIAAKLKRVEANHLGIRKTSSLRSGAKLPAADPGRRATTPVEKTIPRRPLFVEDTQP